ncbi:hypothetical protein FHP25_31855 [Vineibacter terrae]|uniref:Uncharacterized protein n=1 Tax=Vineibacter terrae TaxID=2586908 RepID=A0A5C8PCF5_9HYPH|nr:hypothetical protein [Vineibacter terrae]TXL71069.1 hypothetical protein FHP25_31855 [Vineibacter terrae]
MAGTTLVRTTLTGVRPLGVRGEPLHHAEGQIRAVIRRRLGDRHFHLLAEPEPHDLGGRIDWYSACTGPVRPIAELPDMEHESVRRDIDAMLADIDRLGRSLEAAASQDGQLAGRALRLAAKRPSDDYLFLVGDQPVIVCWGYDTQAAGAVLPPAFLADPRTPAPTPVLPAAPPVLPLTLAPTGAAALPRARFPWLFWLIAGLLAIAVLLLASWLLRQCMPVPPDMRVTELPPLSPPPPEPAPPDPTIGLQGDIDIARRDEDRQRATLVALRDELEKRAAACRPPEAPPQPAPTPDRPQAAAKPGDVLRLPETPTNDYSFLKGCWRGDQFRYTPRHPPGAHTYCFDENGNGRLTFRWQSGVTCQAPAKARYEGGTLRITDADTTCSDGTRWTQDRLVCRPGAGNVAACSGETNMHLPDQGVTRDRPTHFTVRLHRQ